MDDLDDVPSWNGRITMYSEYAEKELIDCTGVQISIGDNRDVTFYSGINDETLTGYSRDLCCEFSDISILEVDLVILAIGRLAHRQR